MTNPLVAQIRAQLDAADGMVDDTIAFVLAAAASAAREQARQIAANPPDPKLSPRAGVNFLVAEGWYQTADWLSPKEAT